MQSFSYESPRSVDDAVALLDANRKQQVRTQILAGGTDLMVQLHSIDRAPRVLLDIKRIPETMRIQVGGDEIFIGAALPCAAITADEALAAVLPGLVEAADLIGSTQIQGRATLGGNLCNSSPAGDTIPAMIADAGICVIVGPGGQREVPVEDFVTGVNENVLGQDEFLVGVRFKRPPPRSGDAYLRFIPRTEMDIAVAGAGVALTLDEDGVCTAARVAIGAVAPTALLVPAAGDALVGTKVDDAALSAAGEACSEAARPITDKRGTVEYRKKVVAVLTRRAGNIAAERARRNG
jgi:CO/xanthine dehydrogenase FAD-binding subunit